MIELDYVVEYYKLKRKLIHQEKYYLAKLHKKNKEIEKLKNYIKNPIRKSDYTLNNILSIVAQLTDVLQQDILGRSRETEIINARHLFCYISYIHNRYSLKKIGEFLNRDHSTVINSIKQYQNYLDCGYKRETRQLEESLELLSTCNGERIVSGNDLPTFS